MRHRIREPVDSQPNRSWQLMAAALTSMVLFTGCPDYSKLRDVPDYSVMTDTGEERNPGSEFVDSPGANPPNESQPREGTSSTSTDPTVQSNDSRSTNNGSTPASGSWWYLLGGALLVLGAGAAYRLMGDRRERTTITGKPAEGGPRNKPDSGNTKFATTPLAPPSSPVATTGSKIGNATDNEPIVDTAVEARKAPSLPQRTGDSFELTAGIKPVRATSIPLSNDSTEVYVADPDPSAAPSSKHQEPMNPTAKHSDLEQRNRDLQCQLDDAREEMAQLRAKLSDKLDLIEKLESAQRSSDSAEDLEHKSASELRNIISELQCDNAKLSVQLEEQIEKKQAARAKLRKKMERIKELESGS